METLVSQQKSCFFLQKAVETLLKNYPSGPICPDLGPLEGPLVACRLAEKLGLRSRAKPLGPKKRYAGTGALSKKGLLRIGRFASSRFLERFACFILILCFRLGTQTKKRRGLELGPDSRLEETQ